MASKSTPLVGRRVGVHYGGAVVATYVIEDRGVFGGERIVRVHVGEWDDPEAPEFELPADELLSTPAAA